jgi:hypothetical protein
MAKGRPPPFVTRGKAAPVPARASRGKAPPPSFEGSRRDVEMPGAPEGSPADMALDRQQAGMAFRKGGKVGGSFPMGKQAKMPK